jgi:hypothetical protein
MSPSNVRQGEYYMKNFIYLTLILSLFLTSSFALDPDSTLCFEVDSTAYAKTINPVLRENTDILMIYASFWDQDVIYGSAELPSYWESTEDSIIAFYDAMSYGSANYTVSTLIRDSPSADSCIMVDNSFAYWDSVMEFGTESLYTKMGHLNDEILYKARAENSAAFHDVEVVIINYHHGPVFHQFFAIASLGHISFPYVDGPGVSQPFGGGGEPALLRVTYHEFGHLLPLGHHDTGQYCRMEDQIYDYSDGPTSYCPIHLMSIDWIPSSRITTVTSNQTNVSIYDVRDPASDVYKIPIYGSEYFLVANHQQTYYDDHHEGTGLLVWHAPSSYNYNADLESAEGRWNWEKETCQGAPNVYTWPFATSSPNPLSGEDELDLYNKTVCDNGVIVYGQFHPGMAGDAEDFWNPTTPSFTPSSNPNTSRNSGAFSDISIIVKSETNGVIVADLLVDSPPQTPQNFGINVSGDHPVLTWTANTETDLDHYVLYKSYASFSKPPQVQTTTVTLTTNSYTDQNLDLNGTRTHIASYKVKAVDDADNESPYSTTKTAKGNAGISKSSDTGSDTPLPDKFSISATYPNPFNPSTNISFANPVPAEITVEVFDLQGRMVSIGQPKSYQAGYHSQLWSPSKEIGSGLYIIRVTMVSKLVAQDGEFPAQHQATQKVLLVR